MANSSQIRTGFATVLQDHLSPRLQNTLFNIMPAMFFFLRRDGDKKGTEGLGRPKVQGQSGGIFVSGIETAQPKREEIMASLTYMPMVQVTGPDIKDGKSIGMADNMPVRRDWTNTLTSTYFNRPRAKWHERSDPYKVSNKQISHTKQAAKNDTLAIQSITSLFQAETVSVSATHSKYWNQRLWGTGVMDDGVTANTGAPSNEDADTWDNFYSFQKALDRTSTYCGVDRTLAANSYWQGADTSTMPTTFDAETIINTANYDLGLSSKGMGIDLLLVDGTNFKKAKSEAKAKGHRLIHSGDDVPGYGRFGFKKELVQVDNTYICYDAECPTGHVVGLNLATWTIAIHPDKNWTISKPFDQSQIEGGDDAMAGTIRTQILAVCECPSMNFYATSITG